MEYIENTIKVKLMFIVKLSIIKSIFKNCNYYLCEMFSDKNIL